MAGLTFSSGLATSTTIVSMLSAGDHIVSMDDLYGGTNRFLRKIADRMNIKTTFVDARNPENVEKAIQENTRVTKYVNFTMSKFIIRDCFCVAVNLG